MRPSIVCALALASTGCAPGRHLPSPAALTLSHADPLAHADARVGTYVSSNWGFSTSSYWIEGPEGLVLVDTQFLPSAASELVDWAEAATGKKVVLAVVLHPNPDKFNGTATLQRRGIRVVTSDEVRALVPAVFASRTRAFASRYAPDWPAATPAPDSFGGATTELHAAGLTLRAHVLGPATSEAHVALEWQGHLFVGDLVASHCHAWLELGHVDEWRQRLAELSALHPTFVHPGRGPSGGPELLDAEDAYLARVKELVLAEHPAMPADPRALERVRAELVHDYPSFDFDVFLGMGLPAVWERYARQGVPASAPAPSPLPAPPAASSAAPVASPARQVFTVAAMGDSLTDARSHGGKFLDLLRQRCPMSRFDNYGKGGQMVNQMRRRFDDDLFGPGKPAYTHVLVFGGVNDLYSDLTAGRTPGKIEADLSAMYASARAHGARVVALTVSPWGGFTRYFNDSRRLTTLELNRWILAQKGVGTVDAVIDTYAPLSCGDPTRLCPEVMPPFSDGLHFGDEGHRRVGEALFAQVFAGCA